VGFSDLVHEEARRAEGLTALSRVALIAGTARDLNALAAEAGREVGEALGATGFALALHQPGQEVCQTLWLGPDVGQRAFDDPALHRALAAEAMSLGRALTVDKPRAVGAVRTAMDGAGLRALVAVPLRVRERCIGSVHLGLAHREALTPAQLGLLGDMAAHLASAAEAQRLLGQDPQPGATAAHYADLRALTAQLGHAQARLAEQERLASLGELSSVVAHELRNSLGALENVLALLRHDLPQRGDLPALMGVAEEELGRMNAVVGDLLGFAQPLHARPSPTAILPLVEAVARSARAGALSQGIFIETLVDAALPELWIDARLMRQALLNLASNGVEAMPQGGKLVIAARRQDPWLRIEVSDEGCGIPEDIAQRIFEPFVTSKLTGVGLGLSLVARVVAQHRGRIEVSAGDGGGTTIAVSLPLQDDPRAK